MAYTLSKSQITNGICGTSQSSNESYTTDACSLSSEPIKTPLTPSGVLTIIIFFNRLICYPGEIRFLFAPLHLQLALLLCFNQRMNMISQLFKTLIIIETLSNNRATGRSIMHIWVLHYKCTYSVLSSLQMFDCSILMVLSVNSGHSFNIPVNTLTQKPAVHLYSPWQKLHLWLDTQTKAWFIPKEDE